MLGKATSVICRGNMGKTLTTKDLSTIRTGFRIGLFGSVWKRLVSALAEAALETRA